MSKRTPKNVGRSIRERLLNIYKEGKHEYMYILQRYFNERLLYRVSVSKYREQFLLKSSLLTTRTGRRLICSCPFERSRSAITMSPYRQFVTAVRLPWVRRTGLLPLDIPWYGS